jgi:RNA polymerase primary sigma factor
LSITRAYAESARRASPAVGARELGITSALAGYPVPDLGAQLGLAARVAVGERRAREEMVVGNLRLVLFWALRYQGRGVELADLFQEGVIGLMRAVELYDAGRGTRFSTYASWRIRSQMQAAVLVAERWSGADPRFDVVVPAAEPDESIDEAVVHASVLCELRQAVDDLDDLGRRVVALRFGLDGTGPLSLNDVARQLHLGSRRVRAIEVEALRRLAEVLDAAPDGPALGALRH